MSLKVGLLLSLLCLLSACSLTPAGVTPVDTLDIDRYLGKWYEIARLDHRFERNLAQVTAEYRRQPNGDIQVINRGFDTKRQQWRTAEGRARLVGKANVGQLKVSFFGPFFFGGYTIFELDKNYQYALVAGNSRQYLWILARQPRLDAATQQRLIERARSLGFPTEQLIQVQQP